jgi:undecaprenyl diphosphate synthase
MAQTSVLIDGTENPVVPRHVAIIMDGNGRWAEKRGKMRVFGHSNASSAVRSAVRVSLQYGIKILTLFAFSSENWRRPKEEIDYLMSLFAKFLDSEIPELNSKGVKVRFIGDLTKFSSDLQDKIKTAESDTSSNESLLLNIAANYGGRWDIVNAFRKIAADPSVEPDNVTEEIFSSYLSTEGEDVDLMIRTGGEMRISNFLIWQLAYAELYVTDLLWPDFSDDEYLKALKWFSTRERRFGCTGNQIRSSKIDP